MEGYLLVVSAYQANIDTLLFIQPDVFHEVVSICLSPVMRTIGSAYTADQPAIDVSGIGFEVSNLLIEFSYKL